MVNDFGVKRNTFGLATFHQIAKDWALALSLLKR